MEDADLEEAAGLAAAGSYRNSGQRCTAVKRMLVHESVADRFVELLVEKHARRRLRRPDGSANRHGHRDRRGRRARLRREGQRCRRPRRATAVRQQAQRARCTRRPCSIVSRPDMPVVKTETFGPVSPVIRFRIDRRGDPHRQLDRLRPFFRRLHQSSRLHHALRHRTQRRQCQRPRGAGLSAGSDAVRRHQGLRHRHQGRRAGSDEILHQREDLLAALVAGRRSERRSRSEPRAPPPDHADERGVRDQDARRRQHGRQRMHLVGGQRQPWAMLERTKL